MPDVPIVNRATITAPKDYTLPQSQEILLKSVRADIDGTGAAGSFLPALQLLSSDGLVMWTAVDTSSPQAAGVSASVTWFPGVKSGGFTPTSGTGVPPAGNLDGYVFNTANQTVTGIGHSDRTNLLVQGNTITLDGFTSIQIQYFCAVASILNGAATQGIGIELWDNFSASNVDKGTIALFENTQASTVGVPIFATVSLTPASGSHTYAIYGWKNVNSGTAVLSANSFIDGTGNIAPMWYRIIVISYNAALPA